MDWEIRIRGKASKNLNKFPKKDKKRILDALQEFKISPYFGDLEKIEGEKNTWRRRVGNYRILYDIDTENKIIEVRTIKRRTSNTY